MMLILREQYGKIILVFIVVSITSCSKSTSNYIEITEEDYYCKAIEDYTTGSYHIALSEIDNCSDCYRDKKIFKDAIMYEIQMKSYEEENGIIPEFKDIYIEYIFDILEVEEKETPQLQYDVSYQSYIDATWELLARYERKILRDNYIENPTILPCNGMSIEKFALTNLGEPDTAVGSKFVDGERVILYLWKSKDNEVIAKCLSYKHTLSRDIDDKVCAFEYFGEQYGYDPSGILIE